MPLPLFHTEIVPASWFMVVVVVGDGQEMIGIEAINREGAFGA